MKRGGTPVREQLHYFRKKKKKKKKPPPTVCMLKRMLTKKESTRFCPIINTLSRIIHYFCFPALLLAFLGVELTVFSRPCTSDLSSQNSHQRHFRKMSTVAATFAFVSMSLLVCTPNQRKDSSTQWIGFRDASTFLFILSFQDGPSVWRTATIEESNFKF